MGSRLRRLFARADAWSVPQRAGAAGGLVTALVGFAILLHLLNPWIRAVALFSEIVLLETDIRPITWVTREPERGTLQWDDGGRGELVLPGGDDPAPGLVLVLGAMPAGPDDPRVLRITDALARIGFVVLLPRSEELTRGAVTPAAVDQLRGAVVAITEHPRLHDDSSLLIGLSVGGALALLAATDERVEDRVAGVMAFGAYYDAGDLLAAAASESVRTPEGERRPWDPDETTLEVLLASLRSLPSEGPSESAEALNRLTAALEGDQTLTPEQAMEAVSQLRGTYGERLDAISPSGDLDEIEVPWFVVHDYGDALIPYEESERIAREREPDLDLRIDLFDHVTPDAFDLGNVVTDGAALIDAFAELIRLSR